MVRYFERRQYGIGYKLSIQLRLYVPGNVQRDSYFLRDSVRCVVVLTRFRTSA